MSSASIPWLITHLKATAVYQETGETAEIQKQDRESPCLQVYHWLNWEGRQENRILVTMGCSLKAVNVDLVEEDIRVGLIKVETSELNFEAFVKVNSLTDWETGMRRNWVKG